jgi:ribosomal-protein-serine acetyltransferase
MHWMSPDYSLESSRHFMSEGIAKRKAGETLGLGIFRGEDLIGSIGFVKFDWTSRRTEIGYWISKVEEGKGIITRATMLLIDYAFDDLNMNRIEIRCSAKNVRSAAVPERLGFKKEGYLRQAEFRNGHMHDFLIFGLLREDRRL